MLSSARDLRSEMDSGFPQLPVGWKEGDPGRTSRADTRRLSDLRSPSLGFVEEDLVKARAPSIIDIGGETQLRRRRYPDMTSTLFRIDVEGARNRISAHRDPQIGEDWDGRRPPGYWGG